MGCRLLRRPVPGSRPHAMDKLSSLLVGLKRRHVYRVAVVYAAIGWLLVQIVTQVFPVFSFPTWSERVVVLVVLAGFPVALLLAWFYELTPSGLIRDVTPDDTGEEHSRPRIDLAILALVIVVAALTVALWQWGNVAAPGPRSAVANSPAPAPAPVTDPTTQGKSIAVLPFENLSQDPDNAYFATGMQEQILTQLGHLSGLKTIARTSTAQYAAHPEDVKNIGRELGVRHVLEGSVQKAGDEVRISVQLIDVDTHEQVLWAETYDRQLSNVLTVESEVAAQVARALQVTLLPKERRQLAQVPTRSPLAYEALLRGETAQQHALVNWKKPDIDASIAHFKAAVADDPRFALAWARLGFAYAYALIRVADVDAAAVKEKCREAFGRALALDPDLPEAHVAAGYYHMWGEDDYAAAREQFKEALAANPRNAEAQLALGKVEHELGHLDDAELAFRRATSLDPRNVQAWQSLAWLLGDRRRYAEADRVLVKALGIDDHAGQTWGLRNVLSYPATGSGEAMLAMVNAAPRDVQANPNHLLDRADALYYAHRYAAALKLYDTSKGSAYSAVRLCGRRGDIEWAAGARDKAKATYTHCVALVLADAGHEDDASDCAWLGWFHARLGRASEALREGRRAVDLVPVSKAWEDGASILDNLARIEAQLGQADQAVAILDRLLSTDHGTTVSIAMVRNGVEWDPIRNASSFKRLLQKYAKPLN